MPIVSIIVPACNAAATLRETLESVLCQTFADFELIVIDDGSTDRTPELVRGISDARLTLVSYPNGGLSTARNRGLARATGEFVSFIDADDIWTSDKLELQLAALRAHPDAGGAYSWTAFLDQKGRFLFAKERSRFQGDVYGELLKHFFIASGSNVLLRRCCINDIGDFDPAFNHAGDWEYMLRFTRRWPLVLVARYQVLYRISDRSLSSRILSVEAAYASLLERAFATAPPELQSRRRESLADIAQYKAFLYLSRAPVPEYRQQAARKLWESIRLRPQILVRAKTIKLIGAWCVVRILPAAFAASALRSLLRLHGKWTLLTTAELRIPAILDRR